LSYTIDKIGKSVFQVVNSHICYAPDAWVQ